ncbi:MAG TPA: TlpA disulfide reductase family protein [Bryobacteraceae bacterium]|nr:TlpA disulfide reductase family protein [Bryobacteraceae bacterium]
MNTRSIRGINTNTLLGAAIGVLTAAFLAVLVFSLRDTTAKEGDKAPQFTVVTDTGKHITPDSFGGKVLVLNFWASWCAPCVEEVPSLTVMNNKFKKSGVVVVAISTDKNQQKYRAFLDRVHASFQTAWDPKSDISAEYGTFQIPETYIIKDGHILRKFAQAEDWTSDDMTQYLQSLL